MRQRGGRINDPYGGRERGPEKIIKGYIVDVKTVRKLLEIKMREMSAKCPECWGMGKKLSFDYYLYCRSCRGTGKRKFRSGT